METQVYDGSQGGKEREGRPRSPKGHREVKEYTGRWSEPWARNSCVYRPGWEAVFAAGSIVLMARYYSPHPEAYRLHSFSGWLRPVCVRVSCREGRQCLDAQSFTAFIMLSKTFASFTWNQLLPQIFFFSHYWTK